MFGPLAGHARIWAPGRSSSHRFRWSGAGNARRRDDGALHAVIDVTPDRDHDLILELSEHELSEDAVRPNVAWRDTEQAWMRAVPAFSDSVADRDVQVAYAVLRGLTSSGGGMVAAATTSLPERAEHGRAYDYRYWWIRDQCYTGQAIAAAGGHPLVDDAVRFVSDCVLADGPGLKPAYSVVGSALPCPAADVSDRPGERRPVFRSRQSRQHMDNCHGHTTNDHARRLPGEGWSRLRLKPLGAGGSNGG